MPRYTYNGEGKRTFPSLGITVKKGESFDGPEGLRAPGLSLASSAQTAPAVAPKEETKAPKQETKEQIKPSVPSDTTAGA